METKTMSLTDQIVALREKTGAGMMDCKRALTEAGGDFQKAIEALRKKGLADAAKKSTRVAKEGVVAACVTEDGRRGAIIELNSETDFVARNPAFQALAAALARRAAEGSLKTAQDAAADIQDAFVKLQENMTLRRFERIELPGPGLLAYYVHNPGFKKGVLLELSAASDAAGRHEAAARVAKELGLQTVAMSPRWLRREDVPSAEIEKEKEIYATQLRNEGKPEAAIPKIVEGKVQKLFYQAQCLLDMVSILDNKTPVAKLLADASAKAGGALAVRRFVRYTLGEE